MTTIPCIPFKKIIPLATLMGSIIATPVVNADAFQRIASWTTANNLPSGVEYTSETSAEIITASKDGNTLIYSDSPLGGIGFIDITQANKPKAAGFLSLNGEPTSVSVAKDYVLAGVNTSANFKEPSGYLATVNINSQQLVNRCELGGQPDSVAVNNQATYVAVAIENERDEDFNEGALPQLPAGNVVIIPLKKGMPQCDAMQFINLTDLALIGTSDPEPEFLDFNDLDQLVVTLQENNHIVIIDAQQNRILNHFSAGSVDLDNIDVDEERALTFNGQQTNRKREPDSVKWLGNGRLVIANEGDYEGGARGFTIFTVNGDVVYESGVDLEHRVALAGHYPEKRSGNKGAEPEGLEVARFGQDTYIFVLTERAGLVAVYKDTGADPEFIQFLPSGIAPEGAVAIPQRNLLITANEKDLGQDNGPRSHVMIYALSDQAPNYPQIESVMNGDRPIGWGALSGMVADADYAGLLYAINDSFYSQQPTIFTIDALTTPAKIVKATPITHNGKVPVKLDMEGITLDGNGGFWIASEGRADRLVPFALYNVNAQGEIIQEVFYPGELLAVAKRFASEGITRIGDTLWIAIQREWEDDPKGMVKLLSYNTTTQEWGAVHYPLETPANNKGWVGLSEITAYGDSVYIIERDNQIADNAKIKRLYRVNKNQLNSTAIGSKHPVVSKELVHDFIPNLKALNGFVVDKIEGFAIDKKGNGYAVTDNDGVDDSSGETYFFSIGKM